MWCEFGERRRTLEHVVLIAATFQCVWSAFDLQLFAPLIDGQSNVYWQHHSFYWYENLTKNEKSDGCVKNPPPSCAASLCFYLLTHNVLNNPPGDTYPRFFKNSHFQIVEMREYLIPSNIAFSKKKQQRRRHKIYYIGIVIEDSRKEKKLLPVLSCGV